MKVDPKWLGAGLTAEQLQGAIVVGWRGWIALLSLYVFAGWEVLGIHRPARADEVDEKIAAAIEPIKKEMSEQREIIEKVAGQLTQSLAESKAAEIRHLVSRRCKETDARERDRIIKELDRKQEEYKLLSGGVRYLISCSEV